MRKSIASCARQCQVRGWRRVLFPVLAAIFAISGEGCGVRELAPACVSAACCASPAAAYPQQEKTGTLGASNATERSPSGPQQAASGESGSTLPHSTAPAARDGWLEISLGEYQRWRELLEKQPDEARQMVARAMQSVQKDRQPRAMAKKTKLSAKAQRDFEQRTLRDRGLLVWRTLETVMDRERVDRALLRYNERYRGKGDAASGFRKACEEISGRGLRWFFDYYLEGTQLPHITLRRIPGNAPNEVAGEIIVKDAPPEYQVRVEMRLYSAAFVINHSVATNGLVTPFTVTTKEPVTRIVLDPDARILRKSDAAKP